MNFRLFFNCGANINDVQVGSGNKPQPTDTVALNGMVMTQLKIGKKIPKNSFSDLITVSINSSSLDSERRNPSPSNLSDNSDPGLMLCPHADPRLIPIDTSVNPVSMQEFTADTNANTQMPLVFTQPFSTHTSLFYTSSELKPEFVGELNEATLGRLKKEHKKNKKMRAWTKGNEDSDLFDEACENGCTF